MKSMLKVFGLTITDAGYVDKCHQTPTCIKVLSSIVIDFVYHGYVPDYFVYKNCVLHTNTLLSLPMLRGLSPGGLCCCIGVTMYGSICRFTCIYLCGSRTLILQNGIKLRNITMLVSTFFSNLSCFFTPRGIDLFFVVIM